MTAASRKLASGDAGSTLPYDGLTWQNDANREVGALYRIAWEPLTAISGTNTITATSLTSLIGALTAYASGMKRSFIAAGTNTGAATLNIDSVGAVSIKDSSGNALLAGAIISGRMYLVEHDGTNWRLLTTNNSREVLTAARSYYVRTDGSDSNTGLANTSGAAWLTIQKAIDVITHTIDLSGYTITINVADGTYTGAIAVGGPWIAGTVILQGNTTTPANAFINVTGNAVSLSNGANLTILGFKIVATGNAFQIVDASILSITGLMVYGGCAACVTLLRGSQCVISANYSIIASQTTHWFAGQNSRFLCSNITITLTGTPAFANAFLQATRASTIVCLTDTFSGSATGTRFKLLSNAVLDAGGVIAGNNSYIPGNAAGTPGTGLVV